MSKTQDLVIDDLNSKPIISKCDKVIVSASINGYGMDIEAEVCEVSCVCGHTLVTVDYVNPISDPNGGRGGCYYIEQLSLK